MNMTTLNVRSVSYELSQAPYQLNIWLGCFILIISNISTIANIIIFSSRTFRHQACSIYLLVQTIILIIFFDFVLLTRTLQKGFQIPLFHRYDILCRLRYFASQYTNLLVITLFILASLDRLLAVQRSQKWRKWSNQKTVAYKLTAACIIIWFLCSFHRLIFYSAFSGRCIAQKGIYALIDNYFEAFVAGICPPIILCVIGILMIRSIRNTIQRQVASSQNETDPRPTAACKMTRLQKTDRQLTKMLLLQTMVAIVAFIPYAVDLVYMNITQNTIKSALWLVWETVIDETIRLLSYIFFGTQFYISIISSRGLRSQIFKIFRLKSSIRPLDQITNTINATAGQNIF